MKTFFSILIAFLLSSFIYSESSNFIEDNYEEFTLENTLKSVAIKDISFNTVPNLGTPHLYFKGLTDFAKYSTNEENILENDLVFSISSKDEIDYSKPILFNNCANPITLGYVNSSIKTNYTINNSENSIAYDGSLLKKCNVLKSFSKINLIYSSLQKFSVLKSSSGKENENNLSLSA